MCYCCISDPSIHLITSFIYFLYHYPHIQICYDLTDIQVGYHIAGEKLGHVP